MKFNNCSVTGLYLFDTEIERLKTLARIAGVSPTKFASFLFRRGMDNLKVTDQKELQTLIMDYFIKAQVAGFKSTPEGQKILDGMVKNIKLED